MSTRERRRTKRHFPNTYESGENADDHGIKKKNIKSSKIHYDGRIYLVVK